MNLTKGVWKSHYTVTEHSHCVTTHKLEAFKSGVILELKCPSTILAAGIRGIQSSAVEHEDGTPMTQEEIIQEKELDDRYYGMSFYCGDNTGNEIPDDTEFIFSFEDIDIDFYRCLYREIKNLFRFEESISFSSDYLFSVKVKSSPINIDIIKFMWGIDVFRKEKSTGSLK